MSVVWQWVTERLPLRLVLPVSTALAASAAWSSTDTAAFVRVWPVALLLFSAFRLADDLADRDRDARREPARVLASAPTTPFWWTLVCATVLAGAALSGAVISLAILIPFAVALAMAYRFVRPRIADVLWRHGLLLSKYPVMVAVLAWLHGSPSPARLGAAAAAVWAGAITYEHWHTRGQA